MTHDSKSQRRESKRIDGWLKIASLVITLIIGAAMLYSRLCVLEMKVEMVADRVGRLEKRLRAGNMLTPVAQVDVDGEPVAR